MTLCIHNTPPVMCKLCKPPDERVEVPGSSLKARPSKRMKRGKKSRPMRPNEMLELVQRVMIRDGRCVVGHYCEGETQAHHWIPQRVLKEHYKPGNPIFRDERNASALCERHHGLIERHLIDPQEDWLPLGFNAFIREFGFEAWWDAQVARRVA